MKYGFSLIWLSGRVVSPSPFTEKAAKAAEGDRCLFVNTWATHCAMLLLLETCLQCNLSLPYDSEPLFEHRGMYDAQSMKTGEI